MSSSQDRNTLSRRWEPIANIQTLVCSYTKNVVLTSKLPTPGWRWRVGGRRRVGWGWRVGWGRCTGGRVDSHVLVNPVAELGHTGEHSEALSRRASRGAPAHRALQYPAAIGVLAHVWSTTITMTTTQDLSLHSSAQHLVGDFQSRSTCWYNYNQMSGYRVGTSRRMKGHRKSLIRFRWFAIHYRQFLIRLSGWIKRAGGVFLWTSAKKPLYFSQ